jgi:hypothetical protein
MVEATGASALVIDYSGHGGSPFDLSNTRPAHLAHYRAIEKLVLRAPAIYKPEAFYDL